jgi:hypothetical protein
METIRIEYQNTLQEAQRASKAYTKNQTFWPNFGPWLAAFMLFCCVATVAMGKFKLQDMNYGVLVVLLLLASFPLWSRWLVARNWRKSPNAGRTFVWVISADNLHVDWGGSQSTLGWDQITRVIESKHGLLLYTQPSLANWIPKHAFSSDADLDKLRSMIQSLDIPYRRK